MSCVSRIVWKDMLLEALEIGSIFLDSNLVTCNKNHKTVHTLWPGNSTQGNKPKERIIGSEILNTPLFASVKMLVLCSGAGPGGGVGSCAGLGLTKHSGSCHPVISGRLPAFTEKEEMTSGDQSRDWDIRKRKKEWRKTCPFICVVFRLQWEVGKPPRLTLVWTSKPRICFLSSNLFVYRS